MGEQTTKEPFCILRHGRKSHTWGDLRDAAAHTCRDPSVSWLGDNIDPARSHLNEILVGSGDVADDVRQRLEAVGLTPSAGQVVARELLFSASHSYFAGASQSGRDGDWDSARLDAWKAKTMDFIQTEFADNLVSATLHLDEAVPHIHCWLTTTIRVEKKGRGRPRKDGSRPAPSLGWTLNHDLVFGSGKDALSTRQDRYAEAMAELGLRRGVRFSQAHHQPIRRFYAELKDKVAAAEAERQIVHDLRLRAEGEAVRTQIEQQVAAIHAAKAKQAQEEAEENLRIAAQQRSETETAWLRASNLEREHRAARDEAVAVRNNLESDRQQLGQFVERVGQKAAFGQFQADIQAVGNLRRRHGVEWERYERALHAYADDLRNYGHWRDAMVRRADRHLKFLFEVGAEVLGHSSQMTKPAAFVFQGVKAWLHLVGGDDLVKVHQTVIGWMREVWNQATVLTREEPRRQRGWER